MQIDILKIETKQYLYIASAIKTQLKLRLYALLTKKYIDKIYKK